MKASATSQAEQFPDEVWVNVHEAKTHLSKLLERVEGGERIVVCRAGEPAVRLERWTPIRQRTGLGSLKDYPWAEDMSRLITEPHHPEDMGIDAITPKLDGEAGHG